jgi:hypothetical protein
MVINFNPKYIPGDIVYNHKKEIIRITSSYLKGTKLFYYRDGEYGWIREDAIKPIPLTPEILDKNGWELDSATWIYKKGYIKVFKLLDDKTYAAYIFEVRVFEFHFIHELQHLLFGLGINHEMEV